MSVKNQGKSRLKKLLTVIGLITVLSKPESAQAVIKRSGDLELVTDEPLFTASTNWYPGFSRSKSFQVKNRGSQTKELELEAQNETETQNLAETLFIEIKQAGTTLYGSSSTKTLENFYQDGSILIGRVPVNDTGQTYSLTVTMPSSSANQYQGGRTAFDLRIGFKDDEESSVTVTAVTTTTAASPTPSPTLTRVAGAETAVVEPTAEGGGEVRLPASTELQRGEPDGQVAGVQDRPQEDAEFPFLNWLLLVLLLLLALILFLFRRQRESES